LVSSADRRASSPDHAPPAPRAPTSDDGHDGPAPRTRLDRRRQRSATPAHTADPDALDDYREARSVRLFGRIRFLAKQMIISTVNSFPWTASSRLLAPGVARGCSANLYSTYCARCETSNMNSHGIHSFAEAIYNGGCSNVPDISACCRTASVRSCIQGSEIDLHHVFGMTSAKCSGIWIAPSK
jgi:hypothetical protein